MQAKPGVIERLNSILTIELTAVNQYFVQAEMCRNWGYKELYEKLRDLSLGEMKDAQEMVRYILFLEGVPNLQRLNDVRLTNKKMMLIGKEKPAFVLARRSGIGIIRKPAIQKYVQVCFIPQPGSIDFCHSSSQTSKGSLSIR